MCCYYPYCINENIITDGIFQAFCVTDLLPELLFHPRYHTYLLNLTLRLNFKTKTNMSRIFSAICMAWESFHWWKNRGEHCHLSLISTVITKLFCYFLISCTSFLVFTKLALEDTQYPTTL